MTQHTPEKKITILKHLASGKTADVVATITKLDRYEVIDLASNHGYPNVDKMTKAVDLLVARLDKDREAEAITDRPDLARAIAHADQPARPRAVPTPAPAPTPSPAVSPLTKPDEIRILLNTAKGHPAKRIQAAADRIFDQLDRLRDLIREDEAKHAAKRAEHAAKEAARAEVKRLEQQLAAAKAKLRGDKRPAGDTPTTSDSGGPSVQDVRTWARENHIDCPDRGPLPRTVHQAYDEAHQHQAAS